MSGAREMGLVRNHLRRGWYLGGQSSIINQSLFNHHHGTSQHPILRKRPGIM
jgi:hypothetical protein